MPTQRKRTPSENSIVLKYTHEYMRTIYYVHARNDHMRREKLKRNIFFWYTQTYMGKHMEWNYRSRYAYACGGARIKIQRERNAYCCIPTTRNGPFCERCHWPYLKTTIWPYAYYYIIIRYDISHRIISSSRFDTFPFSKYNINKRSRKAERSILI